VIITKKALSRRMVLRGLGTTLALPLLDGMMPALSALGKTGVGGTSPRRFSVIYVAHGSSPGYWVPKTEGAGYELTLPLQPLEKFRDRMLVLSGIDNDVALQQPGDPRGGHGRMAPAFMCGVHAKPTQGADFRAGMCLHQHAVLARADHASADGRQPARGLRAALRRRRHQRPGDPGPPPARETQHP